MSLMKLRNAIAAALFIAVFPVETWSVFVRAEDENQAPRVKKGLVFRDRVLNGDELREFTDTITAPVHYKDLMLVLVTKQGVAAVRFTKEIEGGVEYEFRYESADGKTQKSGTGKVTEKDAPVPKSDLFIEAGPIPLRWSYADNGKAWIYYDPSKVAVHLAKAADFKDRMEPSPFDGLIEIPRLDLKRFLRK